jgi:phosphoribosylglycinamide formyltransferase-1
MYGDSVHKAVIGNRDKESGITIHYVNKYYDKGVIIFQKRCKIDPSDTPATLEERIHALEYEHYPKVVEDLVLKLPDLLIKGPEEA